MTYGGSSGGAATGGYSKAVPRGADPDLTQPFWDAAKRHEIVIPRCRVCDQYFWYPRAACPNCMREDWEWAPVSGKGRLYSYTIVRQPGDPRFNDDVPYVFCLVKLDEGVKLASNLIDVEIPDGFQIDMRVEPVFEDITDEWTLIKFRPASA